MRQMRLALLTLAASLAFSADDYSNIQVEKVSAGHRFTEGLAWSKDGFLLFSDVPNNRIAKLIPGKGTESFRDNSNGANGNAFDAQGRLYTCESRTRRVIRTNKNGSTETIAEKWEGKRLNAPNDVVVRKDGSVYFTDPAFGEQADQRDLDFYGVYHISPKGEMELIAKPKGRPNGVALSPNGRILYVSNTDERNVRAYDLDGQGRATNERVLISDIAGPPDGLKTDEKGLLYIAARGLQIYSAQGKHIHTIEISERPSNCAFGDPDLQTLYISAQSSVYRVRLNVKGSVQH